MENFLMIVTLSIIQEIVNLWWSFPMGAMMLIIVYFLMNPEKIEKWSSILARLFSAISKKSERHTVSADIQSRISSYIKNNQANGILPYGLKFKWVKGENASSYLQNENVIVVMDYHNNNARNFITAIREYTSLSLLPKARNDIPSSILKATELIMQEKIIREKRPDALDIFRTEIIPEKFEEDNKIEGFCDRFKKLDKASFFENIFLSEVIFASPRLQEFDNTKQYQEFEKLLGLLEWILTRKQDDESRPLYCEGDVFKTWITLVAKQYNVRSGKTTAYTKRAEEAVSKKFDSIYVTGREPNIEFTQKVIDSIENLGIINLKWVKEFKSKNRFKKKVDTKLALFRT